MLTSTNTDQVTNKPPGDLYNCTPPQTFLWVYKNNKSCGPEENVFNTMFKKYKHIREAKREIEHSQVLWLSINFKGLNYMYYEMEVLQQTMSYKQTQKCSRE